jgi:ABC-type glycerol-3-phosphate transport system substrate-binding protein
MASISVAPLSPGTSPARRPKRLAALSLGAVMVFTAACAQSPTASSAPSIGASGAPSVAASAEPSRSPSTGRGDTIKVLVSSGHQQFNPVWDELVTAFTADSGITVELDKVPTGDIQAKVLQDLKLGGCTYDNVEIPDDAQGALADQMSSVEPFLTRDGTDPGAFKSEFVPWAVTASTFGDSLKYYPFYSGAKGVAYRKDLLEDPKAKADFQAKYGYALPIPPTSPQQLVDIAQFFTKDGMAGIVFSGKGDSAETSIADLVFRSGIPGYTDETGNALWGGPKHPENKAKVEAAAKWIQDLVYGAKVAPTAVTGMGTDEAIASYAAGQAAMIYDTIYLGWSAFNAPNVTSVIGHSGTFELPSFQEGSGGIPFWWGRGIPSCSKHQDAAWTFMKWVMADDQLHLALTKGKGVFVPTKKAVLAWAVDQNVIPVGVGDAVTNGESFAITKATGQLREQINIPLIEQLMQNAITPSQYAEQVGQKMQDLLVQAGVAR